MTGLALEKGKRKTTQWGWPSGWALDLKMAVLGLIRSSLVQVQAQAF